MFSAEKVTPAAVRISKKGDDTDTEFEQLSKIDMSDTIEIE